MSSEHLPSLGVLDVSISIRVSHTVAVFHEFHPMVHAIDYLTNTSTPLEWSRLTPH